MDSFCPGLGAENSSASSTNRLLIRTTIWFEPLDLLVSSYTPLHESMPAIMLHGSNLEVVYAPFTRRFNRGLFCHVLSPSHNGSPTIKDFIRVQSPVIALDHVRLIDGTGAAAKADQTIVISGGKITAIGKAGSVQVPADAQHIDMTPGIQLSLDWWACMIICFIRRAAHSITICRSAFRGSIWRWA